MTNPLANLKCECCNDPTRPVIGVASLPAMPMSIAWCRTCLEADVIPYWAAVANTACCGGLAHTNEEWQSLIVRTLDYHKKQLGDFEADVCKSIDEENQL